MIQPKHQTLKADLPLRVARQVLGVARKHNVTESEIIRRAVVFYLDRSVPTARSGEASDERMGRLREFIAQVLARSRSWAEVQHLLSDWNIGYAPRGGGLVIVTKLDKRIVCKASEVGPAYRDLVRRFGHFPGHPHVHIARKIADETALIDEGDDIPEPEFLFDRA